MSGKFKYNNILTKDFLIDNYNDKKLSLIGISKITGCSTATILRYLKNFKIKLRPKGMKKRFINIITKELLIQNYIKERQSAKEIAKLYNCSDVSILNYLRLYKIKVRTTAESLLGKLVKEKNPNFRHGKNCYPNYCIDCGKEIDKHGRSVRCPKCEHTAHPKMKGKHHTKKSLKLIGEKSKAKFTPEFIKRVYTDKHQGLKKRAINGYTLIKDYNHPDRNKQNDVLEHRLVMEKMIGRRLSKKEIVHHIDQNRTNNNPKNLYLCSGISSHGFVHASFRKLLPILLKSKIIIFKQGNYMINPKGVLGSHRKGVN